MTEIIIDFPALQEIAVKGVRPTAVFLGFGINAAANPNLRDYELSGVAQFRFVPANADEKTLMHFKEEFPRWIVPSSGIFRINLDDTSMIVRSAIKK